MCGIAGAFSSAGCRESLESRCREILSKVVHRGPDGHRCVSLSGVSLGHAHLRFQDLERGAQPLVIDAGSIAISFNGEIYNHKDLRDSHLRDIGFDSDCDAETILRLYESYGDQAFALLNGMFAIAIYDARADILLLVRDRLGKKPLYWTKDDYGVYFSSEANGLLSSSGLLPSLSKQAIGHYLHYHSSPPNTSFFRDIYKVPPAQLVRFERDLSTSSFMFDCMSLNSEGVRSKTKDIHGVLQGAVARRVHIGRNQPVGLFLSSGIDSALIGAQLRSLNERVIAFSFRAKSADNDEADKARQIADYLGFEHRTVALEPNIAASKFEWIYRNLDEPIADPSFLALSLLCEEAKHSVRYALTGDGADEFFLGYEFFGWANVLSVFARCLPNGLLTGASRVIAKCPDFGGDLNPGHKLRLLSRSLQESDANRFSATIASFSRSELQVLLDWESASTLNQSIAVPADRSGLASAQADAIKNYLCGPILAKLDRASMRHGFELRSPFLDDDCLAFASGYTLKARLGKKPLRFLVDQYFSGTQIKPIKRGFRVSQRQLLLSSLESLTRDNLSSTDFINTIGMRASSVTTLLDEFYIRRVDHTKKLWSLLCLSVWMNGMKAQFQ